MSNFHEESDRLSKAHGGRQGPFGIEGVVLMLVRKRRATGQVILETDEDLLHEVYVEMLKRPEAYKSEVASLPTYAGVIATRKINRKANRRDVLRLPQAIHVPMPTSGGDENPAEYREDPRAEQPPEIVSREEIRSQVREQFRGLLQILAQRHKLFHLRVLHAMIACDGNRASAARWLVERFNLREASVTDRHILAALSAIRSYGPARELARLNLLLTNKETD
mgnify:CR=1 FL=1